MFQVLTLSERAIVDEMSLPANLGKTLSILSWRRRHGRCSVVVVVVVVGGHAVGPALFYFENNGRALCFRHCQADSNARTKVIMKRYLFKCIGATVPPAPSAFLHPRGPQTSLCTCTSTNTVSVIKRAVLIPYSFIPLSHLRCHSSRGNCLFKTI